MIALLFAGLFVACQSSESEAAPEAETPAVQEQPVADEPEAEEMDHDHDHDHSDEESHEE